MAGLAFPSNFSLCWKNGWRVLLARLSGLVHRRQVAPRELALEAALSRLDHFDALIPGDLQYVTKNQAETSSLFEMSRHAL